MSELEYITHIALCRLWSLSRPHQITRPAAFPPFRLNKRQQNRKLVLIFETEKAPVIRPGPDDDEADSVRSARKTVRFVHLNTRALLPSPHPRGVQITARRSPTSQMDKDSVRCGAVRRPCLVRDSAYAGLDRDGDGEKNQWWSSGRRGRAAASRACGGAARTAERRGGEGASSLVTHARWPRPARAHGTQHVATGAWRCARLSVHAAPARADLHRFQCEGAGEEETVGAGGGDAIQARTARHGRQATAGAEERSRPMPTLGPGPTRLERAVPRCRLTLAVPLGVFYFLYHPRPARRGARRQPLYVVTTG